MTPTKMDFKANPEGLERISEHKSVKDLEQGVRKKRMEVRKKMGSISQNWPDGDKAGWCKEHEHICDLDSPCAPWDPSEGSEVDLRPWQKSAKVMELYRLNSTWEFQVLKTIHQDMVKIARSGMWQFTSYSPVPHQRSIPGDFSDISPEEMRHLRYRTTKAEYEEYEQDREDEYRHMRQNMTMKRWQTSPDTRLADRVCVEANEIMGFLSNPGGPWKNDPRQDPKKVIISWVRMFKTEEMVEAILDEVIRNAIVEVCTTRPVGREDWPDTSEDENDGGGLDSGEENKERNEKSKTMKRPKNETCGVCGKKFKYKSSKVRHEKYRHTYQFGGFLCKSDTEKGRGRREGSRYICCRRFSNATSLKYHKLNAHNEPIQCKKCSREFTDFKEYTKHRRQEENKPEPPKQLDCDKCGKSFSRLESFKRHLREAHERATSKLLSCTQCGKGPFKRKEGLRRHKEESHGAQKSDVENICKKCGKKFTLERNLKSHMEKIHSTFFSTFKCEQCQKSYKRKGDLNRHRRIIHGD